ncbi:hypothetical protein [Granulicella cerasi]|uniref:hypothetical protein n=1 Tax=Granulicella cerasi TaxID=741063 RepID=UPI0021E05A07|nr:hypothetical protein [Granulicella cerasi]
MNPIVPHLQAERVGDLMSNQSLLMVGGVDACSPAPVLLFKLIAAREVSEVIREFREEVGIVVEAVRGDFRTRVLTLSMPFTLQAVALRMPAVCRVECAVDADEREGALGDLIAGVPLTMISAHRNAEAATGRVLAISHQAIEL